MLEQLTNIDLFNTDPFGIKQIDFRIRLPELSEIFTEEEANLYIKGCDYKESVDDFLAAKKMLEVAQINNDQLMEMHILDVMCGPGALGRNFLKFGAKYVTFHDGHDVMLKHALFEAQKEKIADQEINSVLSDATQMDINDNTFELVVCHNSPHQLGNERLVPFLSELARVTKSGGQITIIDYQRSTDLRFIESLEWRLKNTKPEIVPLLLPTFSAAFSKDEFAQAIDIVSQSCGLSEWSIQDSSLPRLSPEDLQIVAKDPVLGHAIDFSPISQIIKIIK